MSRPTTSGPGARDPRYCAPEVADWDSRNETSDIWSLGCVFLEMFSVIRGRSIREVREHFSQYGTSSTWYCKNSEALDTWLSQLAPQQSVTGEGAELYRHTYRPYIWIRQMLQFDKTARVHAKQLREMIVSPIVNGLLHDAGSFCGKCCSDQEIN
jgi:hypothetical protein